MTRLILSFALFFFLFSCHKDGNYPRVDNSGLIGKWRWLSANYYLVSNNSVTFYDGYQGDSNSSITFLNTGIEILAFIGNPGQYKYSYTPSNRLLKEIDKNNKTIIDTVRILTSNLLVTARQTSDTIAFRPLVIRHFILIDSLSR
ncbi:MAG TPA: hypothetical protein VNX68_10035 [Nitrosopumilaceae archaeon]|jgi:hypothetical protein|nr:hypothetical protein [Nitrosopumilaceae archaeon]